ncbi:MAG: ABC transporter ATP-binding protein [Thermodesulfobacteriota bacterium]
MLELIDVHTYYGESHILHGVTMKVERSSVAALLGRNGMGKTTTVRSIIGFTPPRRGIIRFKGEEITRLAPYKISRMGLALAPQGRRIFPSLSVKENLVLGIQRKGFTLETIYSYFPVLKSRSNHKGNQLSGGEQQMLTIGRALLANPELILMDEPSEGLAPLIIREIGDIIIRLKEQGLSILLVEQNVSLALGVSDYAYVMHHGEIVHQSTKSELAENKKIQAEYIGVTRRGESK